MSETSCMMCQCRYQGSHDTCPSCDAPGGATFAPIVQRGVRAGAYVDGGYPCAKLSWHGLGPAGRFPADDAWSLWPRLPAEPSVSQRRLAAERAANARRRDAINA